MSVSGSNSEVLVGYTNEFPALKTDAPIGHPHIVDLNTIPDDMLEDERNVLKLRFADGIATLLFKVNPVALTAFLNMCNEYFSFWIIEPKSATEGHMFIFRKGSEVTAGYVRKSNGAWDERFEYTITESGLWKPVKVYQIAFGYHDSVHGMMEERGCTFSWATFHNKRWQDCPGQVEPTERGFSVPKEDQELILSRVNPVEVCSIEEYDRLRYAGRAP